MLRYPVEFHQLSEEHALSIFRVEGGTKKMESGGSFQP
jgi:hypothetical protein